MLLIREGINSFYIIKGGIQHMDLDILQEIYEADCESVRILQEKVIMDHYYKISGDSQILMEGFSEFIERIVEWFKKMIKAIKDFFVKFIKLFTDYFLNLKDFVKRNQEALLETEIDDTISGWDFNVLNCPAPNMTSFDKLISSYNTILSDIENIDKEKIKHDSLKFLSVDKLDKLRGEVLGNNKSIKEDDFLKEVRKFYRNGKDDASDIRVNREYVREIVNHVNELDGGKKKAISDRNKIIGCLSKAESFFSSANTISSKNGTSVIKTKTISNSDNSLSFEDGEEIAYEKNHKQFMTLINAKYNETKELSKIINIVVTERANAFKDQVKQERRVVAMAMRPIVKKSEDNDVKESYDYLEEDYSEPIDIDVESFDYGLIEAECKLIDGPILESIKLRNLCRESIWYDKAMEGEYDPNVVMEGFFQSLADAIHNFISKVTSLFRGKAKESTRKYKEWFGDDGVIDSIKDNAKRASFELLDVWHVDPIKQLSEISSVFSEVFNEPKDPKVCPFASQFVKESNIETIKTFSKNKRNLSNILKNYFRCGKPGIDVLEKQTLAGSELSKMIDTMVEYVGNFDGFAEKLVDLDAKAKNLKTPVEEQRSFWLGSFSELEGRPVYETDLAFMRNIPGMESLMEGIKTQTTTTTDTTNEAKNKATEANKTEKATEVKDNNKEAQANAPGGSGEDNEAAKKERTEYFNFCADFAKKLVSAYCTVCEERKSIYINVLKSCADSDHKPVFRDGEYVKREIRIADSKEKTKVTKKEGKIKKFFNNLRKKKDEDVEESYDKPTRGFNWME